MRMDITKIRSEIESDHAKKPCSKCADLQRRIDGLERRLAELNSRGSFNPPRKVNGRFNRPERRP